MSDEFLKIEVGDIAKQAGALAGRDLGERPQLRWIGIDCLRVDPAYQRSIMARGRANVIAIARNFEWLKFGTISVAEMEKGIYLVVDGQHRVAAATLRRIRDVPCQVIKASRKKQAEAFAAINHHITEVSAQQLHKARLAAGDEKAIELVRVCAQAGVVICEYPVPANKMKPGETLAVAALARALRLHGTEVLVMALSCITKTRQGNVGMVRKAMVNALCTVIGSEPEWQEQEFLLAALADLDFVKTWETAGRASYTERCSVESKLVDMIAEHLEDYQNKVRKKKA